jgi:TetR/AcrR family transcriptional repressor of nem operon
MKRPTKYDSYLKIKFKNDDNRSKGERTRDRLKVAAASLLNKVPYRDLRVTDICKQAGISQGTFYLYFENKTNLAKEILKEFVELFYNLIRSQSHADPYDAIVSANLFYFQTARENSGIIRCLLEVGDHEPELALFQQQMNNEWYTKVANSVSRNMPASDKETVLLLVYALGSMMDELVRRLIVVKDIHLIKITKSLGVDDHVLSEVFAVIWFSTLYGRDPDHEMSKPAQQVLKLKLLS